MNIDALFGDPPGKDKATNPPVDGSPVDKEQSAAAVARSMKEDVLTDIYDELNAAIEAGETLETFQKKVETIAQKKGWMQGETEARRAWRAKTIYETNLRQHYQAARKKSLSDPSVLELYPYWQYVHGDMREPRVPRPEHVALDGLVVRADNPWWKTHFGPNGWGCTCGVKPVSRRQLTKMGKDAPDTPPDFGSRKVTDKRTGETRDVPNGIDPGFDVEPQEWLDRLGVK